MIIYKLPSNFKCDHKLPTKVIINCQLMWSLTATMLHNVWCILLYYKSTVLVLQYSTQKFSCTKETVIYVTHSESVLMTHLKGPPPSDMLEHIVKICDFYLFRFFLILRGLPHTWSSRNRLVEYCDQNERNRGSWSQIRLEILPGAGAGKAIPILGRLGTETGSREPQFRDLACFMAHAPTSWPERAAHNGHLDTFLNLKKLWRGHIHFLEYPISLSSVRHVFSCAVDLGNRESYHRSAGGKTTEEKNLKKIITKKSNKKI